VEKQLHTSARVRHLASEFNSTSPQRAAAAAAALYAELLCLCKALLRRDYI